MPREAIAEAVDDLEERVEMADRRERLGQVFDEVEGAAQEGHRHDDEILHRGELVEFLGPEAGQHARLRVSKNSRAVDHARF